VDDILHSRWRIAEGYQLLARRFGDQYAIFHLGSGDTHLVDSISYLVLDQLNTNVRAFDELLNKLRSEVEFESPEQSQAYLNSLMNEFQKLSIIERLDT
jgi:PqqD family protein of HPr-rel-A system